MQDQDQAKLRRRPVDAATRAAQDPGDRARIVQAEQQQPAERAGAEQRRHRRTGCPGLDRCPPPAHKRRLLRLTQNLDRADRNAAFRPYLPIGDEADVQLGRALQGAVQMQGIDDCADVEDLRDAVAAFGRRAVAACLRRSEQRDGAGEILGVAGRVRLRRQADIDGEECCVVEAADILQLQEDPVRFRRRRARCQASQAGDGLIVRFFR